VNATSSRVIPLGRNRVQRCLSRRPRQAIRSRLAITPSRAWRFARTPDPGHCAWTRLVLSSRVYQKPDAFATRCQRQHRATWWLRIRIADRRAGATSGLRRPFRLSFRSPGSCKILSNLKRPPSPSWGSGPQRNRLSCRNPHQPGSLRS
jgi:hypothetical protein